MITDFLSVQQTILQFFVSYDIENIVFSVSVVAGNQGIPESLQKCHSQTKELQRNQTDLYSRFMGLNAKVINLTSEVSLQLYESNYSFVFNIFGRSQA